MTKNIDGSDNEIRKIVYQSIPNSLRQEIKDIWNHYCAFHFLVQNYKCPMGDQVDVDFMKKYNLGYVDIHHIIPRNYFYKVAIDVKGKDSIINISEVNNINNLLPLCSFCHSAIHLSANSNIESQVKLSKEMKKELKNVLDSKGLYNQFADFWSQNVNEINPESWFNNFDIEEVY
ncbi:hypothetical protein [Mycoplasma sp. HU2014]|uniref:hypothetical protein n=1 Tax=Mycoplasma sp. HU2014 TaxID=1664275 RepID=UPI000ACC4876|nr:hypothetical protein [Mycoplasma sp. HU2014]